MVGLIVLILLLVFTPLILVIVGAVMKGSDNESRALTGKNMLRAGLILLGAELVLILIGFAVCTGMLGS